MKKYLTIALVLALFKVTGQNMDSAEFMLKRDSMGTNLLSGRPLTLSFCQEQARLNYPLYAQKDLLKNMMEARIKNLDINYLPQINLNGQATIQSEVTKIPIEIPGLDIPEVPKDMYKLTLDINQVIYDGGMTRRQKKLESVSNEVDQQNVETELDKLKEKVNQLYFTILVLYESEKVIQLGISEMENKLSGIQSGIKNGVLPAINEQIFRVEILKLNSQLAETVISRKNAVKMLGIYMNTDLPDSVNLAVPVPGTPAVNSVRGEYKLFDLQKKKLDISKLLVSVRTMPKFYAFVQLGYGRPGLNMLSNNFDPFAMAGIKLSWNLWNWNQKENDLALLNYQKDLIDNQREIFDKALKVAGEKYAAEIERLEELVRTDREIVALKANILAAAASQFANGTMTATEFVTEKNSELQARLNLKCHEIQYIKAVVDYQNHYNSMNLR